MRFTKLRPLVFIGFMCPMLTYSSELRMLIDMLHENGSVTDAQYQRLLIELEQGRQQAEVENQVIAKQLAEATAPPTVEVTTKGGFRIRSTDGEFETRLRGRFMMDVADYSGDLETGNGTEIRRARLAVSGRVYRDWAYQLDYEFANGGKMRDSFVGYYGFDDSRIRIGLMEIPFQLQYRTSSSHSQMIERSLLGAFGGDRYLGLMADTKTQYWTAAVGLFGDTTTKQNPITDEGWGYGARLTYAPINSETDRLVHLGMAMMHRNVQDEGSVRFRERPEARVAGLYIVDTGDIAETKSFTRYGLEWASVMGRFSTQAEYVMTEVERKGFDDVRFDGWHVQTGFFLTDDSLNYERGEFGEITPSKRVGAGGVGAWELTLRYSSLDLNDGLINGGEVQNITTGLNWYPVPFLRFSANYITMLKLNGGPYGGQKQDVLLLRSQWAF